MWAVLDVPSLVDTSLQSLSPLSHDPVCICHCLFSSYKNMSCVGLGFPGGVVVNNLPASVGDEMQEMRVWGKILGSRKWQSALVVLPGKSHGQRSVAGYSPCLQRVGHN